MPNGVTHWVFPANPQKYHVLEAFAELEELNWGTNNNVKVGDIVYIYLGEPIKKILLKTEVVMIDINPEEIENGSKFDIDSDTIPDKKKYARLKLLDCFLRKKNYLAYDNLKKHGLKGNIRGALVLNNNAELLDYIKLVEI